MDHSSDNPSSAALRPASLYTEKQQGGINISGGTTYAEKMAGRDYYDHPIINQEASPLPAPHGYVPSANTPGEYIPRGPIEEEVRSALRSRTAPAIVGIYAPGGFGKTELAKHAAADLGSEYPDEVSPLWVNCGDRTPGQIIAEMLSACSIELPRDADYPARVRMLHSYLAARQVLIILDDVRQVNATSLEDLIPPCPPCGVLVTSRIAVPSGRIRLTFELEAMTDEQARRLLSDLLSPSALVAEPSAVEQLLARCHNNPLATMIAGKRIGLMRGIKQPIARFLARLKNLRELAVGPDKQLDLFSVMEISYADLMPPDQVRFRRLAACAPSGFSATAAAYLWGDEEEQAQAALDRLVNFSLARYEGDSGTRYRLHDLLYDYACQVLKESGEEANTRDAHAEYLLRLIDTRSAGDPDNERELTDEIDNLRAAAVWAEHQRNGTLLARLLANTRVSFFPLYTSHEWLRWLKSALDLGIQDPSLAAQINIFTGIWQSQEDPHAAMQNYRQALTLLCQIGNQAGEASALQSIGDLHKRLMETDAALQSYQEALILYRALGQRGDEAETLYSIGEAHRIRDDLDAALKNYQEALTLFRAMGSRSGEARTLLGQAYVYVVTNPEQAELLLNQSIAIANKSDNLDATAAIIGGFGIELLRRGEKDRARPHLLRAAELYKKTSLKEVAEQLERFAE